MRTLVWLIGACWMGWMAAPAVGRDLYVSNVAGDDSFSGMQPKPTSDGSGPVHTIMRAIHLAIPGDCIVLEKTDLPYRESISLVGNRLSGFPDKPLTIRGNGAMLDGSEPVPSLAWQLYRGAIFRFRPTRTGYQQLFSDGMPCVRAPVTSAGGGVPELKAREWCMVEGWIYFCVEPTKLPNDYKLTCARLATGITLYHVRQVTICDLTVQGFQLDGIAAFNSAKGIDLVNVVCRGNGRAGVSVGGASTVEVGSSLLGDNGYAQLLTLPVSETHVRGTVLLGNTAPGWLDQGGKFFLGAEQLQGGLDHYDPAEKPDAAPAKAADKAT